MEPFLDPLWYRIAKLKPRLRAHVHIHRHHYRGQRWHVLQDNTTGRFHRFTPAGFEIVARMDGHRSIDEIWQLACANLADDPPSQPECMRLLHQLHAADALQADISPDTEELLRRYHRERRQKWMQQIRSPIFQRLPMVDPDRFLSRIAPMIAACFSAFGAALWLLVVVTAGVVFFTHSAELTANVSDRILDPGNLIALWLVFPFVKVLHELGHAAAVKRWGGEVHEMGLMFLVFSPVPYVDASSSDAFADKRKRMFVGAAGMIVEVFVASLALLLWASVEDGALRTVCYNVILIAGVSTVLFNGNPLLRFDAYYILADWLEIPNLASRSNRYLQYLFERYLAGRKDAQSPASTPGERPWFVAYALSSFAYRMFIYFFIISFVITEFVLVGIALAVWAAFSMLVKPLWSALNYLGGSARIDAQRGRALVASLCLLSVFLIAVAVVPVPLSTVVQGVVWIPEDAVVRNEADGFVQEILASPGQAVVRAQSLVRLVDPLLETRLQMLEAELAALAARYRNTVRIDRVQANLTREAMLGTQAKVDRTRQQLSQLTVRSPVGGEFIMPGADNKVGQFMRQGSRLGFVVRDGEITVRAVVEQDDIGRVRGRTRAVQVRLANQLGTPLPARVQRELPAAGTELPSAALGTPGGGDVRVDPADQSGTQSLSKVFYVDLVLDHGSERAHIGSRAWVRFDHGSEPIAFRWLRDLRGLFLRHLDV